MNETEFWKGRLNRIYFVRGKFQGQPDVRYVKAPMDILLLDGQNYLMPNSMVGGSSQDTCKGFLAQDEGLDFDVAQQGGWYDSKNDVFFEEHQFGDWQAAKDTWLTVHKFGLV